MKDIVSKSGGEAKLRLRGKGSGFVERDDGEESPEPLQLCISCPTQEGYDIAKFESQELLLDVYNDHKKWCAEQGLPEPTHEIKVSEKHLKGDGGGGGGRRGGGGRDRTPQRQKRGGRQKQQNPHVSAQLGASDGGAAPDGAPPPEEINRLIDDRNAARKGGDYSGADRIRDYLKDKGVMLSDEKGGYGSGSQVTTWRYWRA